MKYSFKYEVVMLVVAFASACGGTPDTDVADGSLEAEPLATAASALSECIAVDTDKTYSAGAIGTSSDDGYPMNGRTVTRADLTFDTDSNDWFGFGGHGNAAITKQDSTEVVVHYWYDLFTDLHYHIKIWVEC